MKTRLNRRQVLLGVLGVLCFLAGTDLADNPCIEGGPYLSQQSYGARGFAAGATVIPTNITVGVGEYVNPPLAYNLSVTGGVETAWITFDCITNEYWTNFTVGYGLGTYFSPTLPSVFWTPGVYNYSAEAVVTGSHYSPITNILGTVTINVLTNTPDMLLDVDLGGGTVSAKRGYAALGDSSIDYWNYGSTSQTALNDLQTPEKVVSSVGLLITNLPSAGTDGSSDPMYNGYRHATSGQTAALAITNLPTGTWNIYLYSDDGNFSLVTRDTNNDVATNYGTQTCYDPSPATSTLWQQGVQYVAFQNISVGASQSALITIDPGTNGTALISGLQIASATHNPVPLLPFSGLVSWWRAEGNALDSVGTNNGIATGTTSYAPGMVGQAFQFNSSSDQISLPASPSLDLQTNSGFTVEGWAYINQLSYQSVMFWNTNTEAGFYPDGSLITLFHSPNTNYVIQSASRVLTTNLFTHIAFTYDQPSGLATWYCNGLVVTQKAIGPFISWTTNNIHLGNPNGAGARLDEIALFNRALGSNEVAAIYHAGSAGMYNTNDTMLDSDYDGVSDLHELADRTDPNNPNSVLHIQLGSWSFENTNTWSADQGQLPLTATNIVGIPSWSTNAALIDSASPAMLRYRDVETNGDANINLRAGTIRFWFDPLWSSASAGGSGPGTTGRLIEVGNYNPAFTNGWWSLYLGSNGNQLSFGTSTNGGGMTNLSATISWAAYQWHEVALAYATNGSTLYVDGQPLADGAGTLYYPNLSERTNGFRIGSDVNGANQADGAFAQLQTFNYPVSSSWVAADYTNCLGFPPVIVTQPASQMTPQGASATFTVSALSLTPMTYQWQLNGTNIPEAANFSSYTNLVVQASDDGDVYSVVVSNAYASATSANAVLSVTTPLAITNQPPPLQSVVQGTNVSFYVGVSGNYAAYQWYDTGGPLNDSSRISGVNANTLTISDVQVSDQNYYYAIVTNLFNCVTSSAASLIVITNPVISTPPANTNAIQSDDVTFSVTAPGATFYQWWYSNSITGNNNPITNASGSAYTNYTQLVVQTNNDGFYSVVVTNLAGSTNAGATLNVLVPPWITQQPLTVTTNQGSNVTFTAAAIGTTNLSYQWFENGSNAIARATNASLTLTGVSGNNAGGYSLLVTNVAGTNMSAWAWLSIKLSGGGTTNGWPGGGNAPQPVPSVSMISPTNSSPTHPAIFPYGKPISIRATAHSTYSYITNVAFYFTGTNSGSGTNFMLGGNAVFGPDTQFALAWTNALPGTNILKARAWDYNHNTNDSPLVYVIMTVPPGFTPAPETNLVWTEGAAYTNILLSASLTNDGQPYSFVTNINWSAPGSAPGEISIANPHSLTTQVTFYTNGMNQELQLEVDNGYATNAQNTIVNIKRHPQISFDWPTNNAWFHEGSPLVLKATALAYDGAITGVTYYTNSVLLGAGIQSVANSYTYLLQNPPLWTNLISAVAACNNGLTSTTNVSVAVYPPLAVQFVSPTNGQLFVDSPTNILLTARPTSYIGETNITVVFTNQTQSIGLGQGTAQTNGTYQLAWGDVTNGNYMLGLTAYDNVGNVATTAVTITVNAMPLVNIFSPTNLQSFVEVTNVLLQVTASDSDGSVTNVQIYTNTLAASNLLGSLTMTNAPGNKYDLTWSNLYFGNYPIYAVATDNRGASTVSQPKVFFVTPTNPPPFVEIISPTNNQSFMDGADITITATARNFPASVTNVEFFVNGQNIGSSQDAPYSIEQCCWKPGAYQLMALATDNYGSSSVSSNIQITVLAEPTTGYWDPTFISNGGGSSPIAVSSSKIIYVCGEDADGDGGIVYSSTNNGQTWQTVGDGPISSVYSLLADGTNLYVGGDSIYAGSNQCQLAVWNGSSLAPFGDPDDDPFGVPWTIEKIEGVFYVGGQIGAYRGGDVGTNYVYQFDTVTTNWVPVGNGFPGGGTIYAIAEANNTLYVGGSFTDAGGDTNANYIACLVNNTWTNLGSGITPLTGLGPGYPNSIVTAVNSLVACGTNLFVGGYFTTAGGITNAYGIALWNGDNWQSLNGGVMPEPAWGGYQNYPSVTSLLAKGDRIFVGGQFGAIFDGQTIISANGVAMLTWDNASQTWIWSDLDGGVYSSGRPGGVGGMVIVSGFSPTNYDLYVAGVHPIGNVLDPYGFDSAGSSQIPDQDLARWRAGYTYPTNLPTVAITNPVAYAVFTIPTNILITAVASSDVGISNVNLYANGQNVTPYPMGNGAYTFYFDPPSAGVYQLVAVATDNSDLIAGSKPVMIDVKSATNPITAGDIQYSVPENSPPATFYVLTNDLPASGLAVSQVTEFPTGNGPGLGTPAVGYAGKYITYTPSYGVYGADMFYYTVTNAVGSNDSASVTVNIYPVPQVAITDPVYAVQSVATTNGTVSVPVSGETSESGASVTNVSLYVNGALFGQTTGPDFSFNWITTSSGVDTFIAVATDQNGNTNASSPVTIIPSIVSTNGTGSTSTNQLIGTITNLIDTYDELGDEMPPVIGTGTFDLKGQASASPSGTSFPVVYQVILCQPNNNDAPVANVTPNADTNGFHQGGDNNGDLGVLNLSGVANGVYDLQLNVYGGGAQTNAIVRFILNTPLKVGQFSFSEQDLNLPVHGIPVTVTRTYNSQNLNSADFGYGWTFALNSMNVQLDEEREDIVLGSDQAPFADNETSGGLPQTISVRTGGGYDVSLTLPNGQQTTFAFSLANETTLYPYAEWNAPPWIHASLTPLDQSGNPSEYEDTLNPLVPPAFWTWTPFDAPYEYQDLPGWELTTLPDNTQYYITRGPQNNVILQDPTDPGSYVSATVYGPPTLSRIVEPAGDTIFIKPNSIYHEDTNENISAVVNISRDGQGRITAISDPDAGTNGLPLVQYVYDPDSGNLIQVMKLQDRDTGVYATTTYDYNNPNFPHYITSIENANGAPVTRNYYDSQGRLIQTEDANGNSTQYIYATTNTEMIVDPLGRTNTYVYDASGNIIVQTNALNQVTLMAYDQYNNKTNEITFLNGQPYATNSDSYDEYGSLLSSTDPLGDTNGFTYNGFGEALTSTDARGYTTFNSYDGNGELLSTTNALTNVTENAYNDGLLVSSTDPIGTITTNYYDDSGNLTNSVTLGAGVILSSNTYTYDANGNRLTSTVWRRAGGGWTPATTANIYDAQNRVIATIDPDGGTNTVVYNLIGQQQATIDALGNTNTYAYDALGHLIQTTYPDGTTESSAYDAAGNRTNSVDRLGRTTTYVYDALNRLVETIYPDGATNATVYDDVGRVARSIDARGTITANGYDVAGRRIAVTNAFGISGIVNTNFYSYDANGNQITFTDADGHTTTNVFDPLNRQVQVQYPDGTATETVYDRDGRTVAQTNQDRLATLFGYDGAGRLVAVTNALDQVTRYQYDEAGNEILQVDALNRTNIFAYDSMNRKIAHTMPGGQSEGFAYDLDGNQIYETNFNRAVITNQYDVDNRLIARIYPDGTSNAFTYTLTGQRATMSDASGSYAYAYDLRDRLLTNAGPAGTLSYGYDANGNMTNIMSSTVDGTLVTYQYDPLNRLTNVDDGRLGGAQNTAYHFDAAGNLQGMAYPNGVTNLYQYDSLNRLTNLVWKTGSTSLGTFAYALGATGNRTNLSETINGTSRTYTWQYDHLYRLTNEVVSSTPSGSLFYQYDGVGNRLSRTAGLGLSSQALGYSTNDWLTNDTYDGNGNTINSASKPYQYDYENRLTNFNNGQVILVYDGDGNRVKKVTSAGTTLYLVDTMNPSGYPQVLEELTVSGGVTNLSRAYTWGLGLISQRIPGTGTNFYGFDGHGSVRFLTGTSGSITNSYTYDAFGNVINSSGTAPNSYLYCSQQYDSDLGLYYNRARYLNTGTGRFWTMDTDEGDNQDPLSLHKYLYAADDPVNKVDPSGRDYGDFDINLNSIFGLIVQSVLPSPVNFWEGPGASSWFWPSLPKINKYEHDVPEYSQTFVAYGNNFYAPPAADFNVVFDAGRANGMFNIPGIVDAIGPYGKFDFQRNMGQGVLSFNTFYSAYIHASNYGVGVYLNGCGFSLNQTLEYASDFAHLEEAKNANDPDHKNWWTFGWNAAASGHPNNPPNH